MAQFGAWLAGAYKASLEKALAAPFVVILAAALFAASGYFASQSVPQELTPPEDRGVALLSVTAPQGVSIDYTDSKVREIEATIAPLRESGEVTNLFSIVGLGGGDNRAFMVMTLADWDQRERSQQEIVGQINAGLRNIIGVRAFAIQPNSLRIRGAGQGLRFAILGSNYDTLADNGQALVDRMNEDARFGQVRLDFETTQPQLSIEVDRERASDLGINLDGLGEALQAMLDGRRVGSVFVDDRSFDIQMLSTRTPVRDPGDLERSFIRTESGQMLPLSAFISLQERAIAPQLTRESQQRAVQITASLSDATPLGVAWAEAERLAAEILPADQRVIPLAEAATLDETSSGIVIVFGFAILIVFLVLAAQFESFVSAVVVMATVPLGLACAAFALLFTGVSLNIYSQIGLVLLVGIMAKNGILIVEFANQLRDDGAELRDAILDAATIRLRPVMMTMLSTVLGGVPLVLSVGPGAEAREALGWVIVGGLGLATLATLYLTPVAYLLLARFSKPRSANTAQLESELASASVRRTL